MSAAQIRLKEPLARHDLGVPAQHWGGVRTLMAATRRDAEALLTRAAQMPVRWQDDATCKSGAGRARNLDRIATALRDAPLVRTARLLIYRYHVSRPHPLHMPGDTLLGHMPRDGIETRLLAFGAIANGLSRADDSWFLAVSDHAIGRLLQRGAEEPRNAMLAAHDALLSVTAGELSLALERERIVLPTASGAFLANVSLITKDPLPTTPGRQRHFSTYVWATTFLSWEMMLPEQEREARRLIGRAPRYLDGPLACPALRAPIHMPPEAMQ